MASSTLKGLVANSGKLGYQLWHRPLKMASLVYEREIGVAVTGRARALETRLTVIEFIKFHDGSKYGVGLKFLLIIPRALRSGIVVSPK